jgi:SET domain-containing protein
MPQGSPADQTYSPFLEVRASGISGNGVYALTDIPPGALLTVCGGTVFSTEDCPATHHAMQIGEDLWLWSDGSHLDDSINHSCAPNAGFTTGRPALYSLRAITVGEEICWDYSTSLIENGWSLQCACGSPACRGTIRPFFDLSSALQKRLMPIALEFIRRRYKQT